MKTLKRISALLLALLLAASFSITAFAELVEDNEDGDSIYEVKSGDEMNTNKGSIEENNGTINTNDSGGHVFVNESSGKIGTNKGHVTENDGTVTTNDTNGMVSINRKDVDTNKGSVGEPNDVDEVLGNFGTVGTNEGTVYVNQFCGTVTNNTDKGTVAINSGKVTENYGTVTTNHAEGVVDKNYGTVETNGKNGVVEENNGIIGKFDADNNPIAGFGNYGSVKENFGTITDNYGLVGKLDSDGNPDPSGFNQGVIVNNNNGGTVTTNMLTITFNNDGGVVIINDSIITYNKEGATVGINNGLIRNNETGAIVETNKGTIDKNYSTLDTNDGSIGENYGTVTTNAAPSAGNPDGGKITNNYNNVTDNYGYIKINDGEVTNNYGTVGDRIGDNLSQGTIINNSGSVYISRTADYQDYIENNFGGTVAVGGSTPVVVTDPVAAGVVVNQFSFYASINADNAQSPSYAGDVKPFEGNYWLNDKAGSTGTVTVAAKDGYTLETPEIKNIVTETDVTYSRSGSGWIFTFNSLADNISINIKSSKNQTPAPSPSAPAVVATYKLKFDLGGGVMPDGETELEMKCSAGQKITLPEAPTKEGFTFAGWQTEIRGKKVVFEAGAKYTVSAGKSFVALWEEA